MTEHTVSEGKVHLFCINQKEPHKELSKAKELKYINLLSYINLCHKGRTESKPEMILLDYYPRMFFSRRNKQMCAFGVLK